MAKKVEIENVESTETAKNIAEEKAVKKPQVKKFEPTESIPCRSVTYGELVLLGYKSKLLYTWANTGDVAYVEYQDLQALQSRKSKFLIEPYFVIEDEDLVAQWSGMLKPIYDKITEEDLEEILNLPVSKLKNKLKASPEGIKKSIKSMAAAKIASGEFDSITKIKAIDEVLGTELLSTIS